MLVAYLLQSICKIEVYNYGSLINCYVNGNSSFTVRARSSSGLPVKFSSSNQAVAAVSENIITIKGAGITTITVHVDGNEMYYSKDTSKVLIIRRKPVSIRNLKLGVK